MIDYHIIEWRKEISGINLQSNVPVENVRVSKLGSQKGRRFPVCYLRNSKSNALEYVEGSVN